MYLQHPTIRYLTLLQIPMELRQKLFVGRKYILSLIESLQRLGLMGLITIENQSTRHLKEYVSVLDPQIFKEQNYFKIGVLD